MNPAGLSVGVLTMADTAWLGRWRNLPGHEACETEGQVWVRGPGGEEWNRLPALIRYIADETGRLIPDGRRMPTARMPDGPWHPLTEFLRVRPPAAALPALHLAPVAWRLEPSSEFRTPALMLLPFDVFCCWGLKAPSVRLKPLRFAVSDDRRACVTGAILPPIPGETWHIQNAIAIPSGWALPRGFTTKLVASKMKILPGETVLLHPDGSAERLPAEAFVEATRSALRATARGAVETLPPEI